MDVAAVGGGAGGLSASYSAADSQLPTMRFLFGTKGWERRSRHGVEETWRLDSTGRSSPAERSANAQLRRKVEQHEERQQGMLKQASAQAQRLRASQANVAELQRALVLSQAEVQQTRGSVDAVGPPCGTCQQPLVAHRTIGKTKLVCNGGCSEMIAGVRWSCVDCDFDICSRCNDTALGRISGKGSRSALDLGAKSYLPSGNSTAAKQQRELKRETEQALKTEKWARADVEAMLLKVKGECAELRAMLNGKDRRAAHLDHTIEHMHSENQLLQDACQAAADEAAEQYVVTGQLQSEVNRLTEAISKVESELAELRASVGIEAGRRFLPKVNDGETERTEHGWKCERTRQVRVIRTVLDGRDLTDIALALKQLGGVEMLRELIGTIEFDEIVHELIDQAAQKIQGVWNARHSVHVMSDLRLSRELFELLRHLLSYRYIPPELSALENSTREERGDYYERRTMWRSPFNKRRKVDFPQLQPRKVREAEREQLLGPCKLVMAEDGLSATHEDLVASISSMVGHYWGTGSLLPEVEAGTEPINLMGYGDATGGWRAASITHFESGIASWKAGVSVSKHTLLPSHMMEFDDHAPNLRRRGKPVFEGWQSIINSKKLRFFPRTTADIQLAKEISCEFNFAGDFQIIKAINNMSLYTHPIWCECDHTAITHWPAEPLPDWEAVLNYFEKPGDGIMPCVIKSLKRICQLNGYSYEVLIGEEFTAFDCGQPACKKKHCWKTRPAWQAFIDSVLAMEHAEYAEYAREWGRLHLRHFPGFAPLLWDRGLGMMLFSVDILHLIHINLFKMHLEILIFVFLMEMSEEAREPIEVFLHSKGIPLRLAKAKNLTEVSSSLCGRDAKVLCEKGAEILPELLNWAHAPQEAVEAAAKEMADEVRSGEASASAATKDAHDNVFTMRRPANVGVVRDADDDDADDDAAAADDDEDDVDNAEAELDADALEARKLRYAGYFDDFCKTVHAVRPFELDTTEYRKLRGTELFNSGAKVGNNMVEVRTDFNTAVPHVLTHIVSRQMVEKGDPNRRSCEQSEGIGVDIKFDLHNRCNRRRVEKESSRSKRRNKNGDVIKEYKTQLKCSRVMQVFKNSNLRQALRQSEESQDYLQRRDYRVAATGFSTLGRPKGESRLAHIADEDRSVRKRLECRPCDEA